MPGTLVLQFHVLLFHALQIGPSISRPSFSRPAFSAPPTDVLAYSEFSSVICRLSILALAVLVDLFRRRILAEPGHKVDTCLHALPTVAICV